jgi:hypothetical protein
MWESRWVCVISKDGGKGGKPGLGFPCFPRAVISMAMGLPRMLFLPSFAFPCCGGIGTIPCRSPKYVPGR